MTEDKKKTLSVGKTLTINQPKDGNVRPASRGTISVEVKRRRHPTHPGHNQGGSSAQNMLKRRNQDPHARTLTGDELDARLKALQDAQKNMQTDSEERLRQEQSLDRLRHEQNKLYMEAEERQSKADLAKKVEAQEEEKEEILIAPIKKEKSSIKQKKEDVVEENIETVVDPILRAEKAGRLDGKPTPPRTLNKVVESVTYRADSMKKKEVVEPKKTITLKMPPKKLSKQQLSRAMDGDAQEKERSQASVRRHRQKIIQKTMGTTGEIKKIIHDVIIPETIVISELASRMAVRAGDIVKTLMKMGVFANINQAIDADTAELICTEFGHIPKRITEADFENEIKGADDTVETLQERAPVVTVMGHVDHGKTSLLDALRHTDVTAGESGGITQHIGAYQVSLSDKSKKITFIDTPGHAAFSEMRSRGAVVTDIVILVVAADDGVMEQTIEAINHAKAAGVPIIVAINKIDKPGADSSRIRQELMKYNILLEEFGGEVMAVEVSAKEKTNLDKLEEAIFLQAEMLELKANPERDAQGTIIEARVDKGLGIIATTLVQRGTLKVGDIYVAGTEWGKVRSLINDRGQKIKEALPSVPVEVLGFNGIPSAGDSFIVVADEARAREIAETRQQKKREATNKVSVQSSMEEMMGQIAAGERKELTVLVKADVQGSLEAIKASLEKLGNEEISVSVLHGGVGAINESDITLARASSAIIVGFNVRANPQARSLAKSEGIELRYYSIIYQLIDDVKVILTGLLAPELREKYLGQASVRAVFNVPRMGKAAGCMITEGMVKRGAKVRLLRNNVVIHEGLLRFLRRFKDEVKEVKEGYECGMSFENYQDLKEGDVIECFEIQEIARSL